jgi:16S rRNA (cytidine1402-2'-O)-methyltransferase
MCPLGEKFTKKVRPCGKKGNSMEKGILYLVATPIGNLKDITFRAIEVLNSVDIILSEDTRQTLKLLNHYEIKKQLMSFYRHNEEEKLDNVLELLLQGKNLALVSDAGTPAISDPRRDSC